MQQINFTRGASVLDASSGLPIEGRISGRIQGAITTALALRPNVPRADAMNEWRRDSNQEYFEELARKNGVRTDALGPAGGMHMPRQLEHIHARVLEEKHRTPNGLTQFAVSSEVPVGARTHTVRRFLEDGEAAVYRRGHNIPRVGLGQVEEEFPVRHYVTSFASNHFESLSSGFANTSEEERKMRTARKVLERFWNEKIWNGDDDHGIYGIKNYPYLARKVAAFALNSSSTPDQILGELNDAANYPQETSGSVFAPNRMVTSERGRNYLMNTRIGSVNDTTIGEFFVKNNEFINAIESAHEMKDFGGTGVDGILFYNDDADGISNELVQGITPMPAQIFGFESVTYVYMSHGGVIMRDSGNNILLLIEV